MLRVLASGRTRWVRTLPLVAILAVMVLAGVPAAGASSIAPALAPGQGHLAASAVSSVGAAIAPVPSSALSTALPSAANHLNAIPSYTPSGVHLNFFQNNSTFAQVPTAEAGCNQYNFVTEIENQCVNQAVDPSAVLLANGNIGVAYTVYTNATGSATAGCAPGPTNSIVTERVGFSISTDSGATFGPINFLGNQTCSYLDSVEPSFAVGPTGTVYGAYVQENFSGNVGLYTDPVTSYSYYYGYNPTENRSNDTIGFTTSTNNGVTFSAPISLGETGWIAHPQIAVHGKSIYILYENINNSTSGQYIPYGENYSYAWGAPMTLELLYSPNAGASWSGPYGLPGLNGISSGFSPVAQENGGAIAVSASGTVAVSYFTLVTCVEKDYGYCEAVGESLVLSTSTTNGSSFKGPYTISSGWGSTEQYWAPYYDYAYGSNFEELPTTSIALSPSGTTVYVAWNAQYNNSQLFGKPWMPYSGYESSGSFEATGSIAGTGFTSNILMASAFDYNDQYEYSIAIAANAGGVYTTYSGFNETYCSPFSLPQCTNYLGGSYFEAIQTSADGLTWSGPAFPTFMETGGDPYNLEGNYPGYYSSVTFNATGAPVYVYALPNNEMIQENFSGAVGYFNYSEYPTFLYVATNYTGPTVSLNVIESGLAGTAWSISVDGSLISVPAGVTNFTLGGIAVGETVLFSANVVALVYGEVGSPSIAVTGGQTSEGAASFQQNGTVYLNYTFEYALWVAFEPTNPFEVYLEIENPCCFELYYDYCAGCFGQYPALPWYFPQGTNIEITGGGYPVDAQYWTGLGNGSYTGTGGDANITINGPVNETAWYVPLEQYTVTVQAVGLPSTSTYSFLFDGVNYSASAGSSVSVPNVPTGAHFVTDASATSATSGWTYIGTSADYAPQLVPNSLTVNLTFALVDTSAAVGVVTFQAEGFSLGTPWQMSFNGSSYSSATPWINVSTRPGTFSTSVLPAVAANGSVGYAPLGVPSSWAVTTDTVYVVNFTQAYRVTVEASSGGSVTGGGSTGATWAAQGGSVSLTATAHSGYDFLAWTGTGLGSYSGSTSNPTLVVQGPIVESATFAPQSNARFNLTFTETGLGSGTLWTAYVGGIGYSSTTPTILVGNLLACGATGANYNVSIPTVYESDAQTRYLATSTLPRTECTTGTTIVHEVFAPQYFVSVQSTPGGYATATVGSTTTTTGFWVAAGATVGLDAYVQPGYDFLGWNGTGVGNFSGTLQIDTIVVAGPVLEVAAFAIPHPQPTPRFWLEFTLTTPVAAGTLWTVSVGGVGYTSAGSTLIVQSLLPATYQLVYSTAYSPDGQTKYAAAGDPSSVSLSTNKTLLIGFSTSYWVAVSAGAGGTIVTPQVAAGWQDSGATVTLAANASDGYTFVAWVGTGASAYSGAASTDVLVIHGPVTEVASFKPIVTPGASQTTSTSLFAQPLVWAGLGVVGLLIGLAVGLLVARRGRTPPASPPPSSSHAPDGEPESMTYGGDTGGSA